MTDYEPLDIGGVCNAGPSLLGDEHVETGPQSFLGLPFLIGGGDAGESCFVAVSGSSGAVTVPIGAAARGLVFVHRLLKSEVARGGPLGVDVSDYVFRYDDGSEERVRVRERFEIGSVPGKDDIPGVPGTSFPRGSGPGSRSVCPVRRPLAGGWPPPDRGGQLTREAVLPLVLGQPTPRQDH